jgi:hypothetical protein
MEIIWNKWMPWVWVAMMFGYRFPEKSDLPDVPEGYYRLTVVPRLGHAAKEIVKQFGKVFNDKMNGGQQDAARNREEISMRVADYFDLLHDGLPWEKSDFMAKYFTFELTLQEREQALKQLKGCNGLKVVMDEVQAVKEDAEREARWRKREQYYQDVAVYFDEMELETDDD